MGQTPAYQLPYPELTDPADVPTDMRQLAEDFENKVAIPLDGRMDAIEAGVGSFAKLADIKLAADAALIDFTAIPNTYTHLQLIGYLRGVTGGNAINVDLRCNGDAASNYGTQLFSAIGTSLSALGIAAFGAAVVGTIPAAAAAVASYSALSVLLSNYSHPAGTTTPMLIQSVVDSPGGMQVDNSGAFWRGTAPVNRVEIHPRTGNFKAGSRATLYGLRGT